jgi:hypothetical protein
MFTTCFVASCLLLGQVTQKPAADLAPVVKQLVEELDSSEKSRREDAEQKLLDLGPDALDFLPDVTDRTPAEVVARLARVRQQFEQTRAKAAVQASTVTLKGDQLSLAEVFKEIEKQTGNKVVDYRAMFQEEVVDMPLKLSFENTPFWTALDQILDQAGLKLYDFPDTETVGRALAVVRRSADELPRSGSANLIGAFRVQASEFMSQRSLKNPSQKGLQLQLDAAWEPRLAPIVLLVPMDQVEATDDKGGSMTVTGADAGSTLQLPLVPGTTGTQLSLNFDLPPRSVQKIAKLRGKLTALMPGRMETFRFADLDRKKVPANKGGAKKIEQRKADVTVALDDVRKNNDLWQIEVRIRFQQTGGPLESHLDWTSQNEAYLESPKKEKIPFAAFETTLQNPGEGEVGISYLFDVPDGLQGYTLVYTTPAAIVSIPVQYELKDLQLP